MEEAIQALSVCNSQTESVCIAVHKIIRRDKALRGIIVGNLFFAADGMHHECGKSCDFSENSAVRWQSPVYDTTL